LCNLPNEAKWQLFEYLDPRSLVMLCATCAPWYNFCKNYPRAVKKELEGKLAIARYEMDPEHAYYYGKLLGINGLIHIRVFSGPPGKFQQFNDLFWDIPQESGGIGRDHRYQRGGPLAEQSIDWPYNWGPGSAALEITGSDINPVPQAIADHQVVIHGLPNIYVIQISRSRGVLRVSLVIGN